MYSLNDSSMSFHTANETYYSQQYPPPRSSETLALQLRLESMKAELQKKVKIEAMIRFLQYKNEYNPKQREIVNSEYYSTLARPESDVTSFKIAEQIKKETGELDPSKIILKLCQVCFRGSHKFNPQEQGNKRVRVVEFLLNNKVLFRFQFECANNKIANRATAYESICFLFPGVHTLMLYDLLQSTDPFELLAFQSSQSSIKKDDERVKKETDIYAKLFGCTIKEVLRVDKTDKMGGFSTPRDVKSLDQSFSKKVTNCMFSTLSNTMLQKVAGRSLNFETKLNKKVAASNTLDGDGQNEYTVSASDNQANKYFDITVICQNKADAKAICGLKFLELHAYDVFLEVCTIHKIVEQPESSHEKAASANRNQIYQEDSHLFSQDSEFVDEIRTWMGPPGLTRLDGQPNPDDSGLESLKGDHQSIGSHNESLIKDDKRKGSLGKSPTNAPVSDLPITKFGQGFAKTGSEKQGYNLNPLLMPGMSLSGDQTSKIRADPNEMNSLNESHLSESKLEKDIGRLFDDDVDERLPTNLNKSPEPQFSKASEKPEAQKLSIYHFFKDSKTVKASTGGGKAVQGLTVPKKAKDESDDDSLSKDSDLKSDNVSKDDLGESEESIPEKFEEYEESNQASEPDSMEKIINEYINNNFKPQGELSVAQFPKNVSFRLQKRHHCPSLMDCSFTFKVNDLLEEGGFRIIQYPLVRDEPNFKIRYILEEKSIGADFKTLQYADLVFNSPMMDFEFCSNYGVYVILQRTFPAMYQEVIPKTLRSLLGLIAEDKTSSFLVKSSVPVLSTKAQYGRNDDMNLSAISSHPHPKLIQNFLGHSVIADSSLHARSVLKEPSASLHLRDQDVLSENRMQPGSINRVTGFESSAMGSPQEPFAFSFSFVKMIEDFTKYKRMPDRSKYPLEAEEVKSWYKLDIGFNAFFGQKMFDLESWDLLDVFYHQELVKKRSEHNSFENKIKKKETFYSNVKKNLIDEDYASVLNSLIHTIFKEAMKFNHENNLTSFALTGKVVVVMQARVQNIKLRNKLASMVVLRLLWKEFYERCTVGDLSKRDP